MSKYDKERESLGIKPIGLPSFSSNKNSKYAAEREAILSGKPIHTEFPSVVKQHTEEMQQIPVEIPFAEKPKLQQIGEAFKSLFTKGLSNDQQGQIRAGFGQTVGEFTKPLDAPMNAYRTMFKEAKTFDKFDPIGNTPKLLDAAKRGFTGQEQTSIREIAPPIYKKFADEHPKIGAVTDIGLDIVANPSTYMGAGLGSALSKVTEKNASKLLGKSTLKATKAIEAPTLDLPKQDDIKPLPEQKAAQNGAQTLQKENKFARTVVESDTILPGVKKPLKKNMPEYTPITNKDTLEKARQIVDTDIDEATRIVKGNSPATAETNAMAQLLMQKAQQEGRFQDAIDIVEITSKKATDAGQAIQALSMWGRLTPEGMLKFAQKSMDGKGKLTPDDAKHITDSMNKIKDMADGRAKTVETAKVLDFVASKTPPSVLQKISTLQTMAQLLNPKTAIRNIGGNTAFAGAENVSNVLAAGLDKAIGTFTGKRTTALPSLGTQAKGFGKGFKLGLEDALKGIDTSSMKTQFDLPQRTFRKGPLAWAEKAMNIELKATDRGFYQAAYDDSLRQQMKAAKVMEPTKEMLDNAHLDGLYRTFQDDNMVSKGFAAIKRGLNTLTGSKDWGLGDIVLKYPKTPANLLMRGIDYSPAGVIKALFDLRKGQRAFVQSLSRGITGTSILGAGISLYDLGIITGKRNNDKDVDTLQKTTGGGGYRLNLSALKRYLSSGFDKESAKTQQGDTIINYDWLQPLSISFAAGANVAQNNKEAKIGDILSAVVSSLEGGVSTLAEQPLIQGATKFTQGYDLAQSLIETAAGVPASFVPTALNQVRQLSDNTSRNINNNDFLKKSANMVKNKIPGLSKTLPERVDTLGQTQKVMQDNSLFNVFLNPAFTSKYDAKPEAQLPLDIFDRTGSKEQFPRTAAKSVTVGGQKISFTPEEQAQFQKYIGEFTSEQFRNLSENESFLNMPDESKIAYMKKILDYSTEQAKYKMLQDKK
jgi:hypothetical protein